MLFKLVIVAHCINVCHVKNHRIYIQFIALFFRQISQAIADFQYYLAYTPYCTVRLVLPEEASNSPVWAIDRWSTVEWPIVISKPHVWKPASGTMET